MPTEVSSMTVPGRECQWEKPAHHRDQVLPRSLVMRPVGAKRKPLEKSRLSMAAKSERVKKARRLPSDQSVFYSNIWSPPETVQKPATKRLRPLVDISQVAHVLTTIDYKSGYETPPNTEFFNIWASPETQQRQLEQQRLSPPPPQPNSSSRLSHAQQNASNLSMAISEHESEASSSMFTSSVLSLGPLRMDANTLRRELSSDDFANVASAPVSKPQGKNVVFSTVLTQNNEADMSWNSQFLLGLHEPVRHALYVIDRFLERSRRVDSPLNWNVREFFGWFKQYFVEFVKNQHDVKMKVLLPLVAIKFVNKRDIVSFYEGIFALIEVIIAQEDELVLSAASVAESWQHRLSALQDDIRRLNHLLFNVLALEEETLKPAIEQAFSETAFQRYVMPRIFRAMRPKRIMIPWIVERSRVWGGTKVAKAYKDDLSFTARFLYDHVWYPYYTTHIASAMKHLDDEGEGVAAAESDESWFGCSIM